MSPDALNDRARQAVESPRFGSDPSRARMSNYDLAGTYSGQCHVPGVLPVGSYGIWRLKNNPVGLKTHSPASVLIRSASLAGRRRVDLSDNCRPMCTCRELTARRSIRHIMHGSPDAWCLFGHCAFSK